MAAMAEWLRRWTWNPMGSSSAGSNPVRSVLFWLKTLCEKILVLQSTLPLAMSLSSYLSISLAGFKPKCSQATSRPLCARDIDQTARHDKQKEKLLVYLTNTLQNLYKSLIWNIKLWFYRKKLAYMCIICHPAAMAEWLRRLIRNQMGSSRVGSNPTRSVYFFSTSFLGYVGLNLI